MQVEIPVARAKFFCSAPFYVDTGSDYAELGQNCINIVYEGYRTYTVIEWNAVEMIMVEDSRLNTA